MAVVFLPARSERLTTRPRSLVSRILGLAVVAVSIYLVMPSVVATFSSWPQLARMREGSLAVMALLTMASFVCFWIVLGLCLRSREWLLIAASQLASGAIGRIVPGGAATATAVQYGILKDAGIDKATAATGLTVATLLNFAVLFAMPVFALPALLFGPPINSALVNGAIAAAVSFVAAAILGGIGLLTDRPLVMLGDAIDWVAGRLGRPTGDGPSRADRLRKARDLIREHLSDRWQWVALASLGKWGFEYLALVMAVRGAGHDDTSSILLLAFVTASLLSKIPLTPGGLGFVEAGLTGMLVLAGVSTGDAATATLAYRLVTYWLPIPLGAIAYGLHRLVMHRRGVEIPKLANRPDLDTDPIGAFGAP